MDKTVRFDDMTPEERQHVRRMREEEIRLAELKEETARGADELKRKVLDK